MGVSVISCWEIAKKVQIGKLELDRPVAEWLQFATANSAIQVQPLTTEIAVEACQLPSGFHTDPADQLIVATSRVMGIPLLTADRKILDYPHVSLLK